MNATEQRVHQALRKIVSREKPVKAVYKKGTGNDRRYLESLIDDALEMNRQELEEQVDNGKLTQEEADELVWAFTTVPEITNPRDGVLIATFLEYRLGEVYLHGVAIETNDSLKST